MSDDELQTLISGMVTSARQYIELELTPDRAKATRYYKGEPFGNEEKGRSQFVVTEVHDGVQAVLPSMLRLVFGPERPVEYRPRPATAELAAARQAQAEQATDYVMHCFTERNDGFNRTLAVIKDGLVRKHGIFKWGWDDSREVTQSKVENATMEDLQLLASDPGVEITLVTTNKDGTLNAELTRQSGYVGPWICEVPPEEFIAVRETRSLRSRDVVFVAHQTRLTTGELIAMGIDEKVIKEHGGDDPALRDDELALERNPESGTGTEDVEAGEANRRHLYIEGYTRIDYDGDGIAELRKVCTLGPTHYVVHNDPADDIPFAVWCPDPEPHTLMGGRSWADRLMDMQRLKSSLMRSVLDSAAASVFPRTWYKEGDANTADILNTSIGAPIRTRSGPNAVGEFAHSFMGKDLLGVLELTNDIVERRTGINRGAAGLDANALQSSTKAAVAAAVTASQAQQEMLVRLFVEGALKPMFKGVLKLFVKHKPKAEVVKLRGQWVEVNPAHWDADMDVQVNVALGTGLVEEKLMTLEGIIAKQEMYLQTLGPNNPIVNYKQLRDTIAEAAALRGKLDGSKYFKPITDEQMQAMEKAAAEAPPPPSPEMELAKAQIQIEQMKAQAKIQTDQMKAQIDAQLEEKKALIELQKQQAEAELKLQAERMKMELEMEKERLKDDRERDAKAADIQLKIAEMELQFGVDLSELEITAQIERERIQSQAIGAQQKIESTERVAGAKIASGERTAQAKNETSERVAGTKANRTVSKAQPKAKEPEPAPAPAKPRKRKIRVNRDAEGRAASYDVEDSE